MMIRFIDLFCGLGGFHISIENACKNLNIPYECVFACDIKPIAKQTYEKNFNIIPQDDITKIETKNIPDFDILCAGFPCQPFSNAGNRLGFEDTRGTLFFEIARILKDKQPSMFILENVEGLTTHNQGKTFQTIIDVLTNELGYNVVYKVLDSLDFGLCQSRKRIYIVGSKRKIDNTIFNSNYDKKIIFNAIFENNVNENELYLNNDFSKKLFKNFKYQELFGKSINDKRGGSNNIHSWDIELRGDISDIQKEIITTIFKNRRRRDIASEQNLVWKDGTGLTYHQIQRNFTQDIKQELNDLVEKHYLKYDYPICNKTKLVEKEKSYDLVVGKLSFPITYIINNNSFVPTLTATDLPHTGVSTKNGLRRLSRNELKSLFGYPQTYDLNHLSINDCYDLFGNTICINVVSNIIENTIKNFA